MMNPSASFIMTHLLFFVTLLAGGAISTLQASLNHVAKTTSNPHLYAQNGPPVKAENVKQIEDISDTLLFASSAGGSLCGAYIGIAWGLIPVVVNQNEKRATKIAQTFAASLMTGLLLGTYLVFNYMRPCHWSTAYFLGGVVSSGAWLILSTWKAILNRFVARAEKDGLSGVIDEAKGKP